MRRDFSVDRLHGGLLATALVIMFIGLAPAGVARITKIVLNLPTSPYGTMSFGSVGQYEEIDGIAYGEVDPNDPLSSVIQDMTCCGGHRCRRRSDPAQPHRGTGIWPDRGVGGIYPGCTVLTRTSDGSYRTAAALE